jgi:hypothetical protein
MHMYTLYACTGVCVRAGGHAHTIFSTPARKFCFDYTYNSQRGIQYCGWLRCYATTQKFADFIPDEVTGFSN